MTDAKVRKVVLWIAKIAIMVISAPATVGVVGQVYENINAPDFVVVLVKAAALIMVEGAFFYFWQLVEDTKSLETKEENEQVTYIVSAWLMYLLLLAVGLAHGEGLVSLILRFAMGLLMYSATNDKVQAMYRKFAKERASGKRKSLKVRRAEARAEEEVALHIILQNKMKQIEAVDNQTVLLTRVGELSAQQRILALNKMEVVDGEIITIESIKSLPPTTPIDPVPDAPAQSSDESTTVVEQDSDIVENDCYTITKIGDDFVVACKMCDYTVTKLAAETKNAKTSAIRAASRHCGHHSKEEKEQAVVVNSTNDVETDLLDEQYVMYHEVDDHLWIWECGVCKEQSLYPWSSKDAARDSYRVHAAEHRHVGNQRTIEKAYTPSDEVTFSK